jgi:predicted DNA-binding transcriptional regulator YafY
MPELQHNWSLRLDRIPDEALIVSTSGTWKSNLPTVDVELYLFNHLGYAYRSKEKADIRNDWHPELPKVRRVVRRVSHTFWFFRAIKRYSPDCEIISPAEIRQQYQHTLIAEAQRYGLMLSTAESPD